MLRVVLSLLLLNFCFSTLNARYSSANEIRNLEKKLEQKSSPREKLSIYLDLINNYNKIDFNKSKYYIDLAYPLLDLPQITNNEKTKFYLGRIKYNYNILDYKKVEDDLILIKRYCDPSVDLLQFIEILNFEVFYAQITHRKLSKKEMTIVESLVDSTKDMHSWLLFQFVKAVEYKLVNQRFDDDSISVFDIVYKLEKAGYKDDIAIKYCTAKGEANLTGRWGYIDFINQKIQHYVKITGNNLALLHFYLPEIQYNIYHGKFNEANEINLKAISLEKKVHSPHLRFNISLFILPLFWETKNYYKLIEESLKIIEAIDNIYVNKYLIEYTNYAKIMMLRCHSALGDDLEQYWFNQVNKDIELISNNFKSGLYKAHSDWFYKRENIDSAFVYIQKAYNYKDFASPSFRLEIMIAYAEIVRLKGEIDVGEDIYNKCIMQLNKLRLNNETTIKVYLSFARFLIQNDIIKHKKQIYKYLQIVSANIDKQVTNPSQIIYYREVASLYEQIGDTEESLKFLDKSSNISNQKEIKYDLAKIYNLEQKFIAKFNQKKIKSYNSTYQYKMIFALCLAIIITIFFIYYIRDFFARKNQKLKLKFQNLVNANNELLTREKERIKRDLHDEVGSSLTSISLKAKNFSRKLDSNKAKTGVDEIAKLAYYASRNLSDLVWSLETDNCYHDQVIQRIILNSSNLVEEAGIEFYTHYPKNISTLSLNSMTVKLILQSFKEVFIVGIKLSKSNSITFMPESNDFNFGGKIVIDTKDNLNDEKLKEIIQQLIGKLPSNNQDIAFINYQREGSFKIILNLSILINKQLENQTEEIEQRI